MEALFWLTMKLFSTSPSLPVSILISLSLTSLSISLSFSYLILSEMKLNITYSNSCGWQQYGRKEMHFADLKIKGSKKYGMLKKKYSRYLYFQPYPPRFVQTCGA